MLSNNINNNNREKLRFAGYIDILLIPEGATNIAIRELAPSNNYLGKKINKVNLFLKRHDTICFRNFINPKITNRDLFSQYFRKLLLSHTQHIGALLPERKLEDRLSSQLALLRHEFPLRERPSGFRSTRYHQGFGTDERTDLRRGRY